MIGREAMDRAVAAWPDARARAPGYVSTHQVAKYVRPRCCIASARFLAGAQVTPHSNASLCMDGAAWRL
jgi:hypothetical protein